MKILIIAHGIYSHLISFSRISSIFHQNGNEIVLLSNSYIPNQFGEIPFKYYQSRVMPFGRGFESIIARESMKGSYYADLKLRQGDVLYENRKRELIHILNEEKPKLILLDTLYSTDFSIMYQWLRSHGSNLFFVTTMPTLERGITIPPVSSDLTPEDSAKVKSTWQRFNCRKILLESFNYLKYFGYNDLSILKDHVKNIPKFKERFPIKWMNFEHVKFLNLPELILVPKEFEFQTHQKEEDQYYVGFKFFMRREFEKETDFKDLKLLVELEKEKGQKIIYCSFGSIYDKYINEVNRIVLKIVAAAQRLDEVSFFVSFDTEYLLKPLKQIPGNVFFNNYYPQLYMLEKSDLFLFHGGLNSVREAIHYCVPMLVYPINKKWDNRGNAARICFHNMGMRILKDDNVSSIISKIRKILQSHHFKRNIKRIRDSNRTYTDQSFLDLVEELILKYRL